MEEIRKGRPEDREEIIDFANYVFSSSHRPHDFKSLVPRLYRDGISTEQYHYLVKDQGKIRAMICVMPGKMKISGKTFPIATVGTVSVHPYSRGKGYMKALMNLAVKEMEEQGYAFCVLAGMRQRYAYFGFEQAGTVFKFTLEEANIHHTCKNAPENIQITEIKRSDETLLSSTKAIHDRLPLFGERPADLFYDFLTCYGYQPYAILSDGQFVGYFSQCGNTVTEWELTDLGLLPTLLKALVQQKKQPEFQFLAGSYEFEKISALMKICESYTVSPRHYRFRVFKFRELIESLMLLKASGIRLADGRLTLKIDQETLLIAVQGGIPSVQPAEGSSDIELTASEAVQILFAPGAGILSPTPGFPAGWLPLPLQMPELDCC